MAAPHVAGLAALVISSKKDISLVELKEVIEQSATDLGTPGKDDFYGNGLVNAAKAIELSTNVSLSAPIILTKDLFTVNLGEIFTMTLEGEDPNGDTIVWSSSNLPKGAHLDGTTAVFEWLATPEDLGMHAVVFEASDGVNITAATINLNVVGIASENGSDNNSNFVSQKVASSLAGCRSSQGGIGMLFYMASLMVFFNRKKFYR